MGFLTEIPRVVGRSMGVGIAARLGRYRGWPSRALLLDEPLALVEQRTNRLRRLYANAQRDAWDGPKLFREAVEKHGGIQLSPEKRAALVYPLSMLMWGELAAWIVSAELAERLDDPDARLAASSQVFDEARHVGLGIVHLPARLDRLSPRARRRMARRVGAIGDLFGATQIRYLEHYRTLGTNPRDLLRRADKMMHELAQRLGTVPGTDQPYFRTLDVNTPEYEQKLDLILPRTGQKPTFAARALRGVVEHGSWLLFARRGAAR